MIDSFTNPIAVCVLSFDHPYQTQKCLESILAFGSRVTVTLVHNGSAQKNVGLLKKNFPQIEHVVLAKNLGFSGGANRGLNHCFENHERVIFVSNDVQIESVPFSRIQQEENYLAAPLVLRRNTHTIDSLGGTLDFKAGRLKHIVNKNSLVPMDYVPGSCFVLDKKAWKNLKGFDETLGTYWEDVDLSLRASKLKVQLLRFPEMVVRHGISKTCKGRPLYSVYYFQKNRFTVTNRYLKTWQKPFFYATYFSGNFRRLGRYLKKKDYLRARLLIKATWSLVKETH